MYYVLAEYTRAYGWQPQFGDYDRQTVRDELSEYRYNNRLRGTKTKYRIIKCDNDSQAALDAALRGI